MNSANQVFELQISQFHRHPNGDVWVCIEPNPIVGGWVTTGSNRGMPVQLPFNSLPEGQWVQATTQDGFRLPLVLCRKQLRIFGNWLEVQDNSAKTSTPPSRGEEYENLEAHESISLPMQIERLQKEIQEAQKRGDQLRVAELRLQLQKKLQEQQAIVQMYSNMSAMQHQTTMSILRNIR